MRNKAHPRPRNLGDAEQAVMDYVWAQKSVSAEDCRAGLHASWPMKESTIRTVLRRLEEKGYVTHTLDGRTYIYRAVEPRLSVAARAAKHIIDRFCGGSAEELVIGMVDNAVLKPEQLERLGRKIAQQREQKQRR
jgi:BlaI family transcriptional regulator, penicillinase repressor